MKGSFGEPWELREGEGTWAGWCLLREAQGDELTPVVGPFTSKRIVACVNSLDGLDPEKLGAFLEASKEIVVLANKLVRGNYADMAHADWLGFIDAYDALTGEG